MAPQINNRGVLSLRAADTFSTHFQQIFAAYCLFMTEIWFLLFFCISASKFRQLLIRDYSLETNRIQREFDSNVAIRTFDHKPPAPKYKLLQTFLRVLCGEFVIAELLTSCNAEALHTNRIQREFLFNNCILSQNLFSASSPSRQKTNFLKHFSAPLFLCSSALGFYLLADC
jgi:hypothetical protein